MEKPRHDALTRAVLTGDQHVGIHRPHAVYQLQHRPHRRRLGDEHRLVLVLERAVGGGQPLAPPTRTSELALGTQDRENALVVPGLLEEIAGAAPHGLDRELDRAPGGHHYHGESGVEVVQTFQEIQALLAGRGIACVVEIDQDRVELADLDRFQRLGR